MKRKDLPSFNSENGEKGARDTPGTGYTPTSSLDISSLFTQDLEARAGFELKNVRSTSFGKFLQALPIPTVLVDSLSDIVFANQACAKISADYREIVDTPVSSIFPDATAARKAQKLIDASLSSGRPSVAQGVVRIQNGTMWCRMNLRSVRLGQEKAVLLLIEQLESDKKEHLLRQKHEHKLRRVRRDMESELERLTEERLRKAEAGYRTLVNNSPIGIISCDTKGMVTELNSAAANMLSASSIDAARGANLLLFQPFVEAGVSSAIAKCLKSGKPVVGEYPDRAVGGKRTRFRLNVYAISDESGSIQGAQAHIEDISGDKRSLQPIIRSARLKAVGQMAAGVASSLGELLQSLGQGCQDALRCLESRNYSGMRPLLEQIFDTNRQAARTVKRLQQFGGSRPDPGVSHGDVFDMTEVVREAIKVWDLSDASSSAKKGGVTLDLDLAEGCFIEGEEPEIVEVVVNLLKNAQEALISGGKIGIKTSVNEDQVVLVVKDNGIGISEKHLGRAFEPFWTTKNGQPGMGLTVNFGIIRQHGGTITVMSKKGRGSTFTVRMPFVKESVRTEQEAPRTITEGDLRILLVDDEDVVVSIIQKGLKRLGQTVYSASSGKEALKIFEENQIDAIVCDLAMPGMNGWEVSRAIRAICMERGIAKPPFILCTGWGGQLTEEEILAHPDVDRIVEKPLKVSRLLNIVSKEVSKAATDSAFACRVDGIDIIDYVQLVLLASKQMVLEVIPRSGVRGLLFMDKGRICHAVCGDLEGEEAVYRCLSFRGGSFSNLPWREPERITIDSPTEFLLIQAARRRDEMKDEEQQ